MFYRPAEAGVLAQDAHLVGARGEVRHILRERENFCFSQPIHSHFSGSSTKS
jgi:hypothetical protein